MAEAEQHEPTSGVRAVTDGAPAPGFESERAWLAAIVDFSSDAILSKKLDGTITSWNAAAELLYGYAAAEAIGRSIEIIVPEDRLAELRAMDDAASLPPRAAVPVLMKPCQAHELQSTLLGVLQTPSRRRSEKGARGCTAPTTGAGRARRADRRPGD